MRHPSRPHHTPARLRLAWTIAAPSARTTPRWGRQRHLEHPDRPDVPRLEPTSTALQQPHPRAHTSPTDHAGAPAFHTTTGPNNGGAGLNLTLDSTAPTLMLHTPCPPVMEPRSQWTSNHSWQQSTYSCRTRK